MKKYLWLIAFTFLFILASCQTEQQVIVVTATPEPTDIPAATEPPAATPTAAPTLEPTPQGQIFYDGFDGELKPDWNVLNENSLKWAFTDDGWLKIVTEDDSLLHGNYQKNLFVMDAPKEGNFVIETLVQADTVSNFQQAAIFAIQDMKNFLNISRAYCDLCPTKGDGVFSDYVYENEWGSDSSVAINEDMIYFRIVVNRDENQLINYYSLDGEKWVQQRLVPINLNIQQVGFGATNSDSSGSYDDDLVAQFDYFEIKELE